MAAPLPLVPVADIKAVLTGKECPHMKEKGALKQNKVRASQGAPPRGLCPGTGGGKGEARLPVPDFSPHPQGGPGTGFLHPL